METSSTPAPHEEQNTNNRLWDWRAALLALVIVEISGARLAGTEWAPYLSFTQTMGGIGVLLGLALGYSRFSRQAVLRLTAGYTLTLLPAQLLVAVEKTGWLWQDLLTLLDRLFISLDQFIRNKPVHDHLFFISIMTMVYWLIGLAAGYWLTRHREYLNVVLPSGVAILTVQAFDSAQPDRVWELTIFIFASLLLLGRMYYLKNRSFWRKTHFLLSDEAVNDIERGALAATALAVFIAWSLPGWLNDIKPAAKAWREFSQPIFDKFTNAVSALESPYAVNSAGGEFYGDSLLLGDQAATGENVIFSVEVKESRFTPIRTYWKGRTYDLYLDGRWTTVEDTSEPFIPALDELSLEYPQDRHEMEYTFTSNAKRQSLLYAPAETIWVSKSAAVQSAPSADGIKDVTAWVADTSLSSGEQYKARSMLSDPSIAELRSTGTEYPAWVTERYLQIPEELIPRLKELTLEITAEQETVYDQAQAVTSYLRKEIKYQPALAENPPENSDPVLWVLFEYKKGFCMYYASAETLMLRSIGIPARMSVGFVEGNYDEMERKYTVSYKDSHAWTEVYFPGIGWVEFEPTSNQFPIDRPETRRNPDNMASNTEEEFAIPLTAVPTQDNLKPLIDEETDIVSTAGSAAWYRNLIIPMLILLAFGIGIFIIYRSFVDERLPVYLARQYERRGNPPPQWLKRWLRWTTLSPIERAFQSVNLSLRWLGKPQPRHITSQERASVLMECLPAVKEQTLILLREYQNETFTPRKGNLAKARKAAWSILLTTWQAALKETLQFADSSYNQLK